MIGDEPLKQIHESIGKALGQTVERSEPMAGGCVGQVYLIRLSDGQQVVAKVDVSDRAMLGVEAQMLKYLAKWSALPVPSVVYESDQLLVMSYMQGSTGFVSDGAQVHAAELLAQLHNMRADQYGLDFDTLIGGLNQPNGWSDSWHEFFGQQRLVEMAQQALAHGQIDQRLFDRVRTLADHLVDWIDEPQPPGLIHGDVWSGNVLSDQSRVTGLIDPAIYYADPEIELAFVTLFSCFGEPFFHRYHQIRPIRGGFFKIRRDLYNLYPLLVHARLFGGGYVQQVQQIADHFIANKNRVRDL